MHFYDSIYGHIELAPELKHIINTIQFQRLRNIKQLGLVHYLFQGANHTRFEHSIGVAYLCNALMKKLQLSQPELNISDRDVLLISIAGLIHDLGHASFSHFFDHKLMEDTSIINVNHPNYFLKEHEVRSEFIFKQIVLEKNLDYTDDEIELICSYINPSLHNIDKSFKYEIVSNYISGFDCDKLDYLARDAYYLGHKLNLNVLLLINNAKVINNSICYPEEMMLDIYSVFYSRFLFHKKYYCNEITRGIEYMILDAMKQSSIFRNIANILDKKEFYGITDVVLQKMLESDEPSSIIIQDIYERNIYKNIYETNMSIDNERYLLFALEKVNEFLELNDLFDYFIFDVSHINYGSGKYNPIKKINFYKKSKSSNEYNILNISDDYLNRMYSKHFEELSFRIFTRNNKPETVFVNIKSNYFLFDSIISTNEKIQLDTLGELIAMNINMYIDDMNNL
jgi:HD superfamily phosphohydrolase